MRFVVTKLRDAYVEYWVEVEAQSEKQAIEIASQGQGWQRGGVREFDDVIYPLDEVTRLDR